MTAPHRAAPYMCQRCRIALATGGDQCGHCSARQTRESNAEDRRATAVLIAWFLTPYS